MVQFTARALPRCFLPVRRCRPLGSCIEFSMRIEKCLCVCSRACLSVSLSLSMSVCRRAPCVVSPPLRGWCVHDGVTPARYHGFHAELPPSDGDVVWVAYFQYATPTPVPTSVLPVKLSRPCLATGGHISAVKNFANAVCLK